MRTELQLPESNRGQIDRKLQAYLQYTPTGSTEQLTKAMELTLPLVWEKVSTIAARILQRPGISFHLRSKLSSQKKSDPWTTFHDEEDARNLTSTILELLEPRGRGKPRSIEVWFCVNIELREIESSDESHELPQQPSRKVLFSFSFSSYDSYTYPMDYVL